MKQLIIDHNNGHKSVYNLVDVSDKNLPIAYREGADQRLIQSLEYCRKNKLRVKLNYGDIATGKSWNEDNVSSATNDIKWDINGIYVTNEIVSMIFEIMEEPFVTISIDGGFKVVTDDIEVDITISDFFDSLSKKDKAELIEDGLIPVYAQKELDYFWGIPKWIDVYEELEPIDVPHESYLFDYIEIKINNAFLEKETKNKIIENEK